MRMLLPLVLSFITTFSFAAPAQSVHHLVGYYESWSEPWISEAKDSPLSQPQKVDTVILAFMQPDASYVSKSLDLRRTGIQVPYEGNVLKTVIQMFHTTNPQAKILLAVGGATYNNWQNINVSAIAKVVKDFGLDGVDVDFEVFPNCNQSASHVQCQTDDQLSQIISALRIALPKPYQLTAAAWSIGAYGEGTWQHAKPQGGYTGMYLNPLLKVGDQLDGLNVMSYDAGNKTTTGYDPLEAYAAYKYYFHGRIAMGVEVPPEAWGDNVTSIPVIKNLAQAVALHDADGIMVWSLQKKPNGQPTENNPDAGLILKSVCSILKTSC